MRQTIVFITAQTLQQPERKDDQKRRSYVQKVHLSWHWKRVREYRRRGSKLQQRWTLLESQKRVL
jgi:hypothetical protein